MTLPLDEAPRNVTLQPARREDLAVLANLFQLYAHDFSELVQLELDATGRFDVGPVERFWEDVRYTPFFIRACDKLAGFAIAHGGSRVSGAGNVMDVAEFFVLRGERRQGVGTRAALALLSSFEGPWEIRIRRTNAPGRQFWVRVAERWTGSPVGLTSYARAGVEWDLIATA